MYFKIGTKSIPTSIPVVWKGSDHPLTSQDHFWVMRTTWTPFCCAPETCPSSSSPGLLDGASLPWSHSFSPEFSLPGVPFPSLAETCPSPAIQGQSCSVTTTCFLGFLYSPSVSLGVGSRGPSGDVLMIIVGKGGDGSHPGDRSRSEVP
jgi:hypothetical protein